MKLCSGAGDGIDHSSVSAPHGSAGATCPWRNDQATLTTVSSVPAANTSEPRLTIMFSVSQPRPLPYVEIRRAMPSSPSTCIGPNVTLNPTSIVQKLHRPRRSLSNRPVIFGIQ